jgi:hypothetical protein
VVIGVDDDAFSGTQAGTKPRAPVSPGIVVVVDVLEVLDVLDVLAAPGALLDVDDDDEGLVVGADRLDDRCGCVPPNSTTPASAATTMMTASPTRRFTTHIIADDRESVSA